jgi:hypothetical protein
MFKKFVMKYFHWIGNNKMYGTILSVLEEMIFLGTKGKEG